MAKLTMDTTATANPQKFNEAISRLVDLTNQRSLVWSEVREFKGRGEERLIGSAYIASVNEKCILVYEYEYRWHTDVDEFEWRKATAIEFVRNRVDLTLLYRWYGDEGYRDQLLDAIRYQVAHVDDFFKQLLKS